MADKLIERHRHTIASAVGRSSWVGFGFAIIPVAAAALLSNSLQEIGEWWQGGLLLIFFAIIQAAFWAGFYPGLLALGLSLGTINGLLLPVWEKQPYNAVILNAGFCLISGVILAFTRSYQRLAQLLLESQQDLNLSQSVGQIGNWRLNVQRNELSWSEENYRIFGVPKGLPLTYEFFLSKVHPDDQEYVHQQWQAALQSGIYDLEHRIVVDGKTKWVREKAILEFDRKGILLGGFGITQDISAEKQSEQALKDLLDRYELVLNGAQDAIWDWDTLNDKVNYSSRWKTLRGYSVDDEFSDVSYWMDSIHLDDKARIMAAVAAHFRGETPVFNEEYRIRCQDGTWKWILDRGIAKWDGYGQVVRMAGSEKDITDSKKAQMELLERENQIQLIMNLTPALIAYLDTDFRYVRVNKAYEDWRGIPPEQLVGRKVQDTIGEEAWKIVWPYLERAGQGEKVRYDTKLWFRNEALRWVSVTYVPDIDASGKAKGILVHIADIQELKSSERALNESRERMQLAIQATSVGIWEWNVLTNQIHWDDQMFRIYGIPPSADGMVPYELWCSAVLPEDLQKQGGLLQGMLHAPRKNVHEFRVKRPDSQDIRYIQAVETVRTNALGEVEWIMGTNLDVTFKKNAEAAIVAREQEISLVINSMPALISYVDRDLRYVRANETYQRWLGIPIEKMIGQKVDVILGETAWRVIKPYIDKALSGEQVHYELEIPYATGKVRWIHANYVPDKDADGHVKGIVALIVDIGEIKQAEEKIAKLNVSLQRSVEEMQTIFDTVPIGLAITHDLAGKNIRGNRMIEQMYGLPLHSELSLRTSQPSAYKVFGGGRRLDVDEMPMQKAIRGEMTSNQILDIQRPDGRIINVLTNAVPLFDENGLPRGAVGAFLDISALKQAESALRNSEERLRLAQNAGKLGIFDYNFITGDMQWDGRLKEYWGVGTYDPITLSSFKRGAHPEDAELINNALEKALDPSGEGEFQEEFRVINPKNHQTFWLASFGHTTFSEGKPVRLVGFVQDISERKRAEAILQDTELRLSLAMEKLKAGYWDWDLKTNVVYFSQEWKRQLGYAENELPNRFEEWESRLHPDDRVAALRTVEEHFNGNFPTYEQEFRLRHKDGSYRWIHSRGKLMRDQAGEPSRMLGIHLDITDFKEAKELSLRRERMEESFRLNVASQTVAAIAHELNQPLTAISYLADAASAMLQSGNKNPQKLGLVLETCSEQAQRAGKVIRQLMSVLQKNEMVYEPVDINKIVKLSYDYIKANNSLNSYKFDFNLEQNLPYVLANSLQIQKILIILFDNSLEAMLENDNQDGTVTVITGRYANDPNFAQITVSDMGVGVENTEALNNIFQPFFSTKPEGLGMGLVISRNLVEAHGGKMWAEKNDYIGISVHFTLPLAL